MKKLLIMAAFFSASSIIAMRPLPVNQTLATIEADMYDTIIAQLKTLPHCSEFICFLGCTNYTTKAETIAHAIKILKTNQDTLKKIYAVDAETRYNAYSITYDNSHKKLFIVNETEKNMNTFLNKLREHVVNKEHALLNKNNEK